MEERGWVEVSQSSSDGRVTMVNITTMGLDVIQEVIQSTSKIIDQAFEGLDKDQTDTLNTLLQTVFSNLEH